MGRDVSMEIFGEIRSLQAVKDLAAEMDGYVQPGLGESYLDEYEAVQHIIECAQGGTSINLYRDDTNEDMDGIAEVCREHGLAYRITFERGGYDTTPGIWTWAPGFDKVAVPDVNDDNELVMEADEVSKLLAKGPEVLRARLDELKRLNLGDIPQKVTASAELIAEVEAHLEQAEDNAPGM